MFLVDISFLWNGMEVHVLCFYGSLVISVKKDKIFRGAFENIKAFKFPANTNMSLEGSNF